ncbi:MAG TPA: FtsX-like permease family protein, partial [Acidimicrobiales bacterium]
QHAVRLSPGATTEELRADLEALGGPDVFGITSAEIVPEAVRSAAETQGNSLMLLAAIVGVATLVVLGQLLVRQVRLSDSHSLVLRSLGMGRRGLVADPVSRAAMATVAGSVGAAVVAYAASGRFPTGFVRQLEPDPGLRFDAVVHVLGAILLAVALVAWTLVGVVAARSQGQPGHSRVVEIVASQVRPLSLATGIRFAFGRTGQSRRVAASPVIDLLIVLAVLVGALTYGASLAGLLEVPSRFGNTDLGIGTGGDAVPEDVTARLADDPDVEALALAGVILVTAAAGAIDVVGLQPVAGDIAPTTLSGRLPTGPDETALGRVTARRLGVGVGDELDVRSAAGEVTLRVTGLAVIPGVEGGGLGNGAIVTRAGLERLEPGVTLGNALVRLKGGASAGVVQRLSDDIGMQVGQFDPPAEIVSIERVRSVPYLIALALGALAVLSLAHQLIVSARQRVRDLAIMHALGSSGRSLVATVHWQATAFTLVVAALALPLGYIGGRFVYRRFVESLGAQEVVEVPWAAAAITLVALLVAANLAASIPARLARRLPPAGRLKAE